MEGDILTTINHAYEQDQCSGVFVYSIDNCKPLYIKFSARIAIKVMLDSDPEFTNHTNHSESNHNLYFNDENENRPQENSSKSSGLTVTGDTLHKNIFNPTDLMSDSAKTVEDIFMDSMCESVNDLSSNDGDPELVQQMKNENTICKEKPLTTKYNLRHKSREQINKDNALIGEEQGTAANITEENKSTLSFPENGDGNKKTKGRKSFQVGKKSKGKKIRTISSQKLNDDICFEIQSTQREGLEDEKDQLLKRKKKKVITPNKAKICSELSSESKSPLKDGCPSTVSKPKARPRKLLMEKDVECNYCGVTFANKLDFFNHRRTKGSSFQCKICGKDEPFEAHLMVHMLSHEPQKGYADVDIKTENDVKKRRLKIKCNVCGLIVSSVDSLKVHMILHTGECPYRCCICEDQQFFSLSSLRHHQEVHRISKRFQCKKCGVRFISRTELSKHKLTHEIKCGLCGELFPNKTSRTCHYRVSHPNDIKKCNECFSLFSTDEELAKHIIYHRKGKREQCPECGIVVTKLKDHMIIHSRKNGEKMFACDQCPLKYKRKSTLDKHLLIHTGERPYACNKCPKRFRSNGMLRKHLLTHTLERPFVCEVCGKQCSVRSNLVTHMRIHSETRKYPCTHCLQAFNYKTSLEIHMKCKHSTPDTPSVHTCLRCSQNFQDESSLTAHMVTAHPEPKLCKEVRQEQPLPLPVCQEPTFSTPQEPPMMPFIYPEQSHTCQTSIDSHMPIQNSSIHTILNLDKATSFETTANFPIQSSSIHLGNNLTSSNVDSFERNDMLSYFGRERTSPLTHQSSILSVPPAFHFMPPGLEQLPHSINFGSIPLATTTQKPVPESNDMGGYGNV